MDDAPATGLLSATATARGPGISKSGNIDLKDLKLGSRSYFPDWRLQPRRRADKAHSAVVAEAYVRGVSNRRVGTLVRSMGSEGIRKSQVSMMAKELDSEVKGLRSRPWDDSPYNHLWVDALAHKSREAGHNANLATVIAFGVTDNGQRKVLGLDVITAEDGARRLVFLRNFVARGPGGGRIVTSGCIRDLRRQSPLFFRVRPGSNVP